MAAAIPLAVEAAPEVAAVAEEAGGVISRGFSFVKGLLGGGGGGGLGKKIGTSLLTHDAAGHIEQDTGFGNPGGVPSGQPRHQAFGTPGYDGVPANVSSSQFGGL